MSHWQVSDKLKNMNNTELQNYSIRVALFQVLSKWKILVLLGLLAVLGALLRHKFFPVYPGQGKLMIKDQGGASLGTVLSQFNGASSLIGNQTTESRLTRSLAYLETMNFSEQLAKELWIQLHDKEMPETIQKELFSFLANLGLEVDVAPEDSKAAEQQARLAHWLMNALSWSSADGGQIVLSLRTDRKAWTTYLINESLEVAKKQLTARELKDVDEATAFFRREMEEVETRLDNLEKSTINKLQKSKILNLEAAKGEASDYLTGLQKNINDTQLRISEGDALLKDLKKRARKARDKSEAEALSKFALSGRIKQLQDELKTLRVRLATLKQYLKSYGGRKQSLLPFQNEMERLKANYQFEYKVYENLRDGMAKLGLERTFIENQIEVLERERAFRVRSRPGVLVLLLVALTISQIIGLAGITIFELLLAKK